MNQRDYRLVKDKNQCQKDIFMNLLLDVVQFIRKNRNIKLSAIDRVLMFTLAGRIGYNEETWISQKELVDELRISERTLNRSIENLKNIGLLLIKKKGRHNRYSFDETQFIPTKKTEQVIKKHTSPMTGINADTRHQCRVYTRHQCRVSQQKNTEIPIINHEVTSTPDIPKYKKANIQLKTNIKTYVRSSSKFDVFWNSYPRKENKKKSFEIWTRKKLEARADLIIADVQKRIKYHGTWIKGFIPHATTYLTGERWDDEITEIGHGQSQQYSGISARAASVKRAIDRIWQQ